MDIYRRALSAETGQTVKEALIYFFELNQCFVI
jgi:hypothetical protein